VTNVFSGRPARGIVNHAMRELAANPATGQYLSPIAPPFPYAGNAMGMLKTAAERQGSADFSSLWSGQNASACRSAPAADIVAALAHGFA
jgi:nitronate monooxygenase